MDANIIKQNDKNKGYYNNVFQMSIWARSLGDKKCYQKTTKIYQNFNASTISSTFSQLLSV